MANLHRGESRLWQRRLSRVYCVMPGLDITTTEKLLDAAERDLSAWGGGVEQMERGWL